MEIVSTIHNVESIRLFGSYARGEETQFSDFDILVILNKSQVINPELEEKVKQLFKRDISISWYSRDRIDLMFHMGHLFAWHLFLESKPVTEEHDIIAKLGVPKQYTFAEPDILSLIQILEPIKKAVVDCPQNIVYEAGLTYVCARNIAICALPALKGQFSFSVSAPYELNLNLSREDFENLIKCRYASTRGFVPPRIDFEWFCRIHDVILDWALDLKEKVKQGYLWKS
jgi:predicted nucleotidyltransferase